jgi:hypothetical protein
MFEARMGFRQRGNGQPIASQEHLSLVRVAGEGNTPNCPRAMAILESRQGGEWA